VAQLLYRRAFLAGIASPAAFTIVAQPVRAAEFEFKFSHDLPVESSVHVRSVQMANAIFKESGGRLKIAVFPYSQLGGQASALLQVRQGVLELMATSSGTLTNFLPGAGIEAVGFAFSGLKQAWGADDGELGDSIRKQILASGLVPFPGSFEFGMRQMTTNLKPIRTTDDMPGFKIRVAQSRIVFDMFRTLGANPTPLNPTETYAGLQTRLIDGTDQPLDSVEVYHFYEVQRYLSITNHGWNPYWVITSSETWQRLPGDIQDVVRRNVRKYSTLQRRDIFLREQVLVDKLKRHGMAVNVTDTAPFKAKLSPYYQRWKQEFGTAAWSLLERYSGKLA
jgi:tripartite ATP-independent transporter DctP family solute receptor